MPRRSKEAPRSAARSARLLRAHLSAAPAPPASTASGRFANGEESTLDWNRYADLFARAPVGCILMDLNGVVLEINIAACRILDVVPARIVGYPLLVRLAQPDRRGFLDHLQQVRNSTAAVEAELDIKRPDGERRHLHFATRRSPGIGDLACWTVLTDVTEQRRLAADRERADAERIRLQAEREAAEARNQSKDEFIAHLSHELRTPLSPVLFAVAMLASADGLPGNARELLSIIQRNVDLEVRLIDDLLDVTRIERGKLRLERTVIDVHEILDECVTMAAPEAQAAGIGIEIERRAFRSRVNADPVRLRQAFWNVINNAIKFSRGGGRVRIATANDDRGAILVRIADSGRGIAPGLLPRLFQPFEQAEPAPAPGRVTAGLGLGLAITKGIVDAHGGRLIVSSSGVGDGATFEFQLATVAAPVRPPPPPAAAGKPLPLGLRVLLIEDHADSAQMLAATLGLAGCTVEIAATVADARARAAEGWDVVISDLGLPDGSGLEVARFMREHEPPPRLLLALSGYGAARDIAESQQAGFQQHLVKPVDVGRLLDVLRNVTGQLAGEPARLKA